ncbi:hypothetical protein Emag_007851 [Eimeria magna]
MVDDEISSTSSHHSGMQLRSRKVPRPPAPKRSRSPRRSSSRRGKGGVAALIVGNGPCMTSEDDRSYPSASSQTNDKEDNEPFELRTNRKTTKTGNEDQPHAQLELTAERESTTQLQNIMHMLSNIRVQKEEQKREQEQQRQEQLKQRKLLNVLLRSNPLQSSSGTHNEMEEGADEERCEGKTNIEQHRLDKHESWTTQLEDPATETISARHTKPTQSYYVNKFNGQNPVEWISVLEFGALLPHKVGGSIVRKEEEEQSAVLAEEDRGCNPYPAEPLQVEEARYPSRPSPSNFNGACVHSTLATACTLSCPNVRDNTQKCGPHIRTSHRTHHQNSPPSPSPTYPGLPEQPEDTNPRDATHPHTQCTNPCSPKHRQDCRASEQRGPQEPCALDILQTSEKVGEAQLPQQAESMTEPVQHPQQNRTKVEQSWSNLNGNEDPQTLADSPQAESGSGKDLTHLAALPLETHPRNLGTGRSKEDRERIHKLLMKWLGPCSAALFLRDCRKPSAALEIVKDPVVERSRTPKPKPDLSPQDLQTEGAVEDCMHEGTAARDPQRSRSQRIQQRWSEVVDLERLKGQELTVREREKSLTEARAALESDSSTQGQQCSTAFSSVQQPSPTIELGDKGRPTASPESEKGAAEKHPLAFLRLTIKGKPVVALLDTGCTHVLISSDLADELQLKRQTMESPTRMLLGNGEEMDMKEMTEELKCKAGKLYFKVKAILAPIPFDSILEQPFLHEDRLLWRFGPSKLTGRRGGRRLVLPISEEKLNVKTMLPEREKLWKDGEEIRTGHEQLEKVLRDRGREEAEAMVRPSLSATRTSRQRLPEPTQDD